MKINVLNSSQNKTRDFFNCHVEPTGDLRIDLPVNADKQNKGMVRMTSW